MKKNTVTQTVAHIFMLVFCVSCVMPFILLISASLESREELVKFGVSIFPRNPNLLAYQAVFEYPMRIIRAFGVTLFVTIVGTLVNISLTFVAGYALSNRRFLYRRQVSFFLYFTMLFSGGLVPTYILVSKYLHLTNNIWVMILPGLAAPMQVFLMRTYLSDIPYSLQEAAKIDGANEFDILIRIILPMAATPIAIIGFQMALGYWNAWNEALIYITDTKLYPLQMFLQNILQYVQMLKNSQYSGTLLANSIMDIPNTSVISATCFVTVAPMMFAFLIFQKQFIQGVTNGAVKE